MNRREAKAKTAILRRIIRVVCKTLSVTTGKYGAEIKAGNGSYYTKEEGDALASLGIIPTTYCGTYVPFDKKDTVISSISTTQKDINTMLDELSGRCNYFASIIEEG